MKSLNVSTLKQVELDTAVLKLRDDGIMQFDLKAVEDFTVDDLKEINEASGVLGNQKAYPILTVVDHFFNADAAVRKYSATEESNRYTVADAFVVEMLAVKIIGNFYISFDKPSRPTRMFQSEDEAVAWLKTFL